MRPLIEILFSSRSLPAEVLGRVSQLIFPSCCILCGELEDPGSGQLCTDCFTKLSACVGGDYCPRCGSGVSRYAVIDQSCPYCDSREFYFDGIARVGIYESVLRKMIVQLKFSERTSLVKILGQMCAAAYSTAGFCGKIDYFVPVPLHWLRRLKRGFNQSYLLAKHLPLRDADINTALVRIRNTPSQRTFNAAARKRNVEGAFAVRRGCDFAGKNICLVDDITTTRATVNECARVLKQAGAARVYVFVPAVAKDLDY